ncbi:hypothetical protein EVAR_92348_1 [Eumeta japonica]|uniref:Uncharacterized protein n=1 Tax=Eumeta variegata TaxID=151549 RepID=A0A4C1TIH5_EUMVA|nr:hypothetical protein EVAR_92348_1 [Eumeta japonica]
MQHHLVKSSGRADWILQGHRRFETLVVGCGLEVKADIGVLQPKDMGYALGALSDLIQFSVSPIDCLPVLGITCDAYMGFVEAINFKLYFFYDRQQNATGSY